jgi:hypothetical protein
MVHKNAPVTRGHRRSLVYYTHQLAISRFLVSIHKSLTNVKQAPDYMLKSEPYVRLLQVCGYTGVVIELPNLEILYLARPRFLISFDFTGVNEWRETVGGTGWFLALNIFFGAIYVGLLALVSYKFIRKVRATGFVLNISFVYLFFQAVFCSCK